MHVTEFNASERGSNKKQATAVCALSMVRQLYAESLIEKHGDPIKHVSRGSILEGGRSSALVPNKGNMDEQNRKRKAEDQVVSDLINPYHFGLKKEASFSNVKEKDLNWNRK